MQKSMAKNKQTDFYINSFCNALKSVCFEFLPFEKALEISDNLSDLLTNEEIKEINRYMVLKNLESKVSELTLITHEVNSAVQTMLEFDLTGSVLIYGKSIQDFNLFKSQVDDLMQKQDKIKIGIYIDNILDFSEEDLCKLSDFTGKEKLPIYLNFLRTLDEAGSLDKLYGKSPAKVLEDFGFLDRKCYCVGCNFLDKDDAEVLYFNHAYIILTPLSDMMLGKGAVNLQMLLGQGLTVSLGSDSYIPIDMNLEGKIALGNTANLMYDPKPIERVQIYEMISSEIQNNFLESPELENQKQKIEKILRRIK